MIVNNSLYINTIFIDSTNENIAYEFQNIWMSVIQVTVQKRKTLQFSNILRSNT